MVTAAHCTMYITEVISPTKILEKKTLKLPQDKKRLKELTQQCVEKGNYNNPKTKMKMKCKYIETSGGKLKNLEITTMPKGAVWAGVMNLLSFSGNYS